MRLLHTMLMLFIAFFSTASPAISDTSSGIMKDFQFIQNNQRIQPDGSGALKLARSAFSIRYTGKGLAPSIYASFNPKLKKQFKELHDPIISFAGTGSAAHPSQLYVDNEALDFYQGWSAAFETAWGSVQDSKGRAEYVELRSKLASEPMIIMSGRNYSNFEPQPDGTLLFTVNRINDSFPPFKDVAPLYLIVFADKTSVTPDASSYLLHWTPLTVEFKKK